jgi:hypothetical protein
MDASVAQKIHGSLLGIAWGDELGIVRLRGEFDKREIARRRNEYGPPVALISYQEAIT